MILLAVASQPESPLAWLAGAWAVFWPIASTIGTIVAFLWAVVKSWPLIKRTFGIVDIVTSLPEQLAELKAADAVKLAAIQEVKATLDAHIVDTAAATIRWSRREDGIDSLLRDMAEVKHEVKHNGGSSIKDAVARIEDQVTSISFADAAFVTGQLRLHPTTTEQEVVQP